MFRIYYQFFSSLLFLLAFVASPVLKAEELRLAEVQQKLVSEERVLDGVIEAVHKATVSAQTSGRVTKIYFDVDDYVDNLETNPKNDNAKLPLFDDLKPYLDLPVNILLIGHSAGGDIANRASEYLIDTGNDYRLGGTVLLDPFMYYPGKDLAQIADGITAEHPVFLADTAQDYRLVNRILLDQLQQNRGRNPSLGF